MISITRTTESSTHYQSVDDAPGRHRDMDNYIPEHDDGCEASDSCLECPLPRCQEDAAIEGRGGLNPLSVVIVEALVQGVCNDRLLSYYKEHPLPLFRVDARARPYLCLPTKGHDETYIDFAKRLRHEGWSIRDTEVLSGAPRGIVEKFTREAVSV